jgi:hypothetical protein
LATPISKAVGFAVGQKVQSRFGGKAKYYGATIVQPNADGTYEVKYDDGDVETATPAEMISSFASVGEFEVGQRIEARFGGKNKFYLGNIVKDNGDGYYEVRYDDGDVEKAVQFIRTLDGLDMAPAAVPELSPPVKAEKTPQSAAAAELATFFSGSEEESSRRHQSLKR